MAHSDSEIQIGAQGRVVIPAHLRKALGFKPGDRLVARQVGESLVDELIGERRAEAAREEHEP